MVVALAASIDLTARRPVLAKVLPTGLTRSAVTVLLGADRSPWRTVLLFALASSAVIYLIGTAWLCLDTGMSVREGISAGVTPFRPGDSVKVLLAAGLLPGVWRLAGRGTGKGIAQ